MILGIMFSGKFLFTLEEDFMKGLRYFFSLLSVILAFFICACSNSSSGDGDGTTSTPGTYSSTTIESVSTSTTSGKTFSTESGVRLVFASGGVSGTTYDSDGSTIGTFTYDGTTLTITTSSTTEIYGINIANNIYYLTVKHMTKEDGSSGLYGKWVNATSNPLLQTYVRLYSNGKWTNASYESQGYSEYGTWICNNGIISMLDLNGNATFDSGHIIYDGSRLYLAFTLTIL